jgi:ABC-2 type transport system permease protein
MIRGGNHVATVLALTKRDLRRSFRNPTGYVFVTLFIFLGAAAAFWRPRFFLNSLANLDPLNEAFPYLLLFFIPALAMNLWTEERKQGTDELLLTLPASEGSLVLGKYLTAASIYTVSLVLSMSHALVLRWLGHPDWGLLAANYIGFWLLGMALIPVAMLASLVTANATIAFILASVLCAVPVGIADVAATLGERWAKWTAAWSVLPYFGDFTHGIVSIAAVVYFASLASIFLFLDVVILKRRRWRTGSQPLPMAAHAALRTSALIVSCACLVVLANRIHLRFDLTAERLSSLAPETRDVIAEIPTDRTVRIQGFITADVPEPLVQTRENLINAIREIGARSSSRVSVSIEDAEPYSEAARIARERFNIAPRRIRDALTGDAPREVYLGVAVTSGADESVIPFFDPGLSPEYEIVRAIRVVTRSMRKRVGIIDTDVRMLGGIDYQENEPHAAWAAVQELRKQYDVVEVTPTSAADASVDALVVVLPSRMTQTDLDLAMEPIRRGVPTLLLVDPLPMIDLRLAPAADLASRIDPYRREPSARLIYGNIRQALEGLGINWAPALIAWDVFNPHPGMADLPQEAVFVSAANGNPNAFSRASPITARLQEVMFLYPGYLTPVRNADFKVEPLVETGTTSGSSSFFDLVVPTNRGMMINANASREPDHRRYVIAEHIRSRQPIIRAQGARPVNIVAVADLDFISDYFFDVRASAPADVNVDNVSFFLNAIDVLAGDDSMLSLRSRRARHRTLERLEAQTRTFVERRTAEEQQAEKEAREALDVARGRLKGRIDELNGRSDLDVQSKQIMVRNLEEVENRQLRVLETSISQAKDAKISASRENMETAVQNIRTRIKALAVLLPPVPVFIAGLAVFVRRLRRERESARAIQRLLEET